jgi:subtilisin family serine protease
VANDPDFPVAWHAHKIGLPDAWDVSTGSASTVVAVLDTGVIASQPDFAGRVLPALSATGSLPMDGNANHHGTYVAGTLAMQIDNGVGSVGVGNFSILPITVTDELGHNSSDWIADGIRLAADRGARVINVSLGTLSYGRLDSAAAYARSKGALTFVAAGNADARNPMSAYDNLIFVSGTDRNDDRWTDNAGTGSSWGPYVDLSAPAHDIRVIAPSLEQGYGWISGTSFASPLAAGAAALAFSINPNLTPEDVQAMLYATAVDLGEASWDEVYGHGRLDVAALSLAAAATVPEPGAFTLTVCAATTLLLRRRRQRATHERRAGRASAHHQESGAPKHTLQ